MFCNARKTNNKLFVIRDLVTFKAPIIAHTNHSEEYPEDGSVYEPKHVARNTTNTSNKLRVVYDYITLYFINIFVHFIYIRIKII
jgi:hypothetical protein